MPEPKPCPFCKLNYDTTCNCGLAPIWPHIRLETDASQNTRKEQA